MLIATTVHQKLVPLLTSPEAQQRASVARALQSLVSTPATDACLNTTELLENILRFLDFKTLLLAQRVSRNFQNVIVGSLPLQQKLFLAPATFEEALSTADGGEEKPFDRILKNWCVPHWPSRHSLGERYCPNGCSDFSRPCMINPALFPITDEGSDLCKLGRFSWNAEQQKWEVYFWCPGGTLRGDATVGTLPLDRPQSFLSMYVAHPAPQIVGFWTSVRHENRLCKRFIQVAGIGAHGPLTFAELYRNLVQELNDDDPAQPCEIPSEVELDFLKCYTLSGIRRRLCALRRPFDCTWFAGRRSTMIFGLRRRSQDFQGIRQERDAVDFFLRFSCEILSGID